MKEELRKVQYNDHAEEEKTGLNIPSYQNGFFHGWEKRKDEDDNEIMWAIIETENGNMISVQSHDFKFSN